VSRHVAVTAACHGPPKNLVTARSRDRHFRVSRYGHL
jgi:hypothetical protein